LSPPSANCALPTNGQQILIKMSAYKRARQRLQIEVASARAEAPIDPQKLSRLEVDLKVLESNQLRDRAKRFGIELVGAVGPWETDSDNRYWLRLDKQYAEAEKVIQDARYDYWKKWVDLLSPVVSVVISVLAFALAALALYFQVAGKIR
jgi:hypothetical protein